MTVNSDCCKKGPAVSLRETPQVKQPFTEGAATRRQSALEGVGFVDQGMTVILLSPTTSTLPRGLPRTELAFLTSLFSLSLSAAEMLLPQQTTQSSKDYTLKDLCPQQLVCSEPSPSTEQ